MTIERAIEVLDERGTVVIVARSLPAPAWCVSPPEASYASRLPARERYSFASGRSLVRRLLAGPADARTEDLDIRTTPSGRPVCLDLPGVDFSVSHSGRLVVVGCSHLGPIGVDVQVRGPVPQRVVERIFPSAGKEEGGASSGDFFSDWTVLEAYAKGSGRPLHEVLRTVPVDATRRLPGGWMWSRLEAGPDHAAAVARRVDADLIDLPVIAVVGDHPVEELV